MIEILAALAGTATASAAAVVVWTKRHSPDISSPYDGRDDLPTNPYGLPDAPAARRGPLTAAELGYDTQGAPEGYGYTQNTNGTWVLVKLPGDLRKAPPKYDGPRGDVR